MTIDVSMVPSATEPPANASPSSLRRILAKQPLTRRGILRTALATGMVVGLTALDKLPRARGADILADPYPTRYDCNYPNTWKDTCNRSGSTLVSSAYCASHGWHRTGRVGDNCEYEEYQIDYRCGPRPGGGNYNAWRWKTDGVAPEYRTKRCSDGRIIFGGGCRPDTRTNSACIKLL